MRSRSKLLPALLLILIGLLVLNTAKEVARIIDGIITDLVEVATTRTAVAATIYTSTDSLELVTSAACSLDVVVSYVDYTSSAATPGAQVAAITTATTTTVLSAPAASTQRQMKRMNARNKSTTTCTVTMQRDVSGTNYELYSTALGSGDTYTIDSEGERHVYGSDGLEKLAGLNNIDGRTQSFLKVGATSEAAGLFQLQLKDTGMPGAWVPGTPGVNGDAVSCNTTADATIAGAPYLPDPATGNYYLTSMTAGQSVASMAFLIDVIWYNTGLTVTTTTAQTITLPTLPARDTDGSTNGEGWYAAILVTTATTNASAVTNTTLSYTDSEGNAGNTATISSFPATAVAGAFIPFQLAAGDRGIRNIASITLGTSYATGAISLVLYRPIAYVSSPLANVGGSLNVVNSAPTGVKLWNGTCLAPGYLASATTATNTNINAHIVVR